MHTLLQDRNSFASSTWRASLVVFLAFLVPVSPILAEIQVSTATRACTQTTSSASPISSPSHLAPSYRVMLDLLGQRNYSAFAGALFPPGAETKACDKGRSDANLETDGTLWFIMGFALTIFAPILAYLLTPSVPESHLNGKSASYASSYADCYQQAAKAIHVKWAWYGLGTVFLAALLAGMILWLSNTKVSN